MCAAFVLMPSKNTICEMDNCEKKIRVLMFVANTNKKSGVATVIMNYYSKIYKQATFDFLYFEDLDPDNYNCAINNYGGHLHKICSPYQLRSFRRELKQFCEKHKGDYDIFHFHTPYLGFLFHDIARLLGGGVTIIAHAHVTRFGEKPISFIRNGLATKLSLKIPDYYFACSERAGQYNFGHYFDETHGFVINNAIEVKRFIYNITNREETRKEINVKDEFVVGHIGNFTPQKNHSFLLKVFAEMTKIVPNAQLVLIGDGYLKESIKREAAELNVIHKVHFLGVRNDVNSLLSGFDCFLFPSLFEGLGIALIEAQTNGLPCIISDCIPKEAKVCNYFEYSLSDSPNKWASVLYKCISRQEDSETLVKNAGFELDHEAHKLIDKYKYCIEGKKHAISR